MDEYRDHVIYPFPKRKRISLIQWIMLAILAIPIPLLIAKLAYGQQLAPVDPALQQLNLDWNSLVNAQGHVATDMNDIAKALNDAKAKAAHLDALDAYLKACQDKPGCTAPVEQK